MKLDDLNLLSFGNTILMTGVIFEGEGKALMCFFPGENDPSNVLGRLDMDHEDWMKLVRQTDVMETEILAKAGGEEDRPRSSGGDRRGGYRGGRSRR